MWFLGTATVLAAAISALAGVGVFTFSYPEAFSHFSTGRAAFAKCHVMQPQYDSW